MVYTILNEAYNNGITYLDTSSAYGEAEDVLGKTMQHSFNIISKYPKCDISVQECFDSSLSRLNVGKLYGYLLHHFDIYRSNPDIWNDMICLKRSGKVSKIGFSLYSPHELKLILDNNLKFDLLQIPRNIFDNQFDSYFPLLKDRNVEIHVRSTFLQGLFFKDRNTLPDKLKPLKQYLLELDRYVKDNGISMAEAALNFNLQNPYIDGVLIGVDNISQLQMNLSSILHKDINIHIDIKEKELINPVNWQ